jgi:parallel beta-helix repeat protein
MTQVAGQARLIAGTASLLLVLVTAGLLEAACVEPPAGMVAWLPGNGDATDIAGSNDGTLVGGATFAAGKVGQAFSLDGIDDAVDLGNDASLHVSAGDFTVDAWVRFDSLSGDMSIVDKMSGPAINRDGWRFVKQADNRIWFCFGQGTLNGCFNGAATTAIGTTVVTAGVWYHVAAVKTATSISVYVNGVLEGSSSGAGAVDTHQAPVTVGAYPAQGARLDGLVDEVEIFDRALTADEIAAIHAAGADGKCVDGCHARVPGDHPTIQAAVDGAPNPGPWTICVLDGVYAESVQIAGANTLAADASQRLRIKALTPLGATVNPSTLPLAARNHAFSLEGSRFVTIEGFRVTGARQQGIRVRGGATLTNRDVTLLDNEVTANGSGASSGGIFVGRENANTVIEGNRIHRNGRNGIEIEADAAGNVTSSPKSVVDNVVCGNGWNGLHVGRTVTDVVTLTGNAVHCNGTAGGTTGGRFGLFRQTVQPTSGKGFRQNIVLEGNALCRNQGGDIAAPQQTLGPLDNDTDNVTTLGTEEQACVTPGCEGAIVGVCGPEDCEALCPAAPGP